MKSKKRRSNRKKTRKLRGGAPWSKMLALATGAQAAFNPSKFASIATEKPVSNPSYLDNATPLGSGLTHTVYREGDYVHKPFGDGDDTFGSDKTGSILSRYAQLPEVDVAPPGLPPVEVNGKIVVSSKYMPHKVRTNTVGKVLPEDYDMVKSLVDRCVASGIDFSRDAFWFQGDDIYIINPNNIRCDGTKCYVVDVDGATADLRFNDAFFREFESYFAAGTFSFQNDKIKGPGFEIDLPAIDKNESPAELRAVYQELHARINAKIAADYETMTKKINDAIALAKVNPNILLRRKAFFSMARKTHPQLFTGGGRSRRRRTRGLHVRVTDPANLDIDLWFRVVEFIRKYK